jgi:hypothetical protein
MPFGCSRRFFGSIPKQPGDSDRNEDAFRWRPDRLALALSDGATESFDSRLWAAILARRFVRNRELSPEWTAAAIRVFRRRHRPEAMSWSRRAAFERGSFATLLGVETSRDLQETRLVAVGDTVAVLLDGNEVVASFPYASADDFRRRPALLSTRQEHNEFLARPDPPGAPTVTWRLGDYAAPRIACMTDAVAEWFLRLAAVDRSAGDILLALADIAQFEAVVTHEREAGRMRVDDATVLILE